MIVYKQIIENITRIMCAIFELHREHRDL